MVLFWIRNLIRRPSRSARRAGQTANRKGRNSFRPSLECLETRVVPAFLAPVNIPAGLVASATAMGDFNGDGKLDIVTGNNAGLGSAVTVLLGNGNGTFRAPVSTPTGSGTTSIITGDFNRDGKLDLAMNSVGSTSIKVLMGNGDGTFQAPVSYLTGAFSSRLAKGDFNGDGADDIVGVSTGYGGTVFVLKNAGNGTFLPAQGYAAGVGAVDVKVVDINHDGKLDLVVANQSSVGGVNTLMGNGDGTFQSSRSSYASTAPYREVVGDFNNDGNPDIVVLNSYTANQMNILLGNPDGTFQAPHAYYFTGGFNDLEAGDFNGDGNLDLIQSNGQVELGRGDGSFYAVSNNAGFFGSGLAVGDFNGDGALDVVTGSSTGNATLLTNAANDVALLGGATHLKLSTPATVTAGVVFPVTVTALDVNGNVATGFLGTVGFTNPYNPAQATSYTFTAADAGIHTIANAGTLFTAGAQTLIATSPLLPTASTTVNVTPAAATHFGVSAPATALAGDSTTSITVSALDAFGNVAPSYARTIHFTSSDVQAVLPADYIFTAANVGVHSFNVTLKTSGSQTVSVVDTLNVGANGLSAGIAVTPGVAVGLSLSGGGGYVNSPHIVAVYARDIFGNVATSYNGTAHLTTSDALATLSPDGPVTNGVGFFTITPRTMGTQTITVVDVNNASFAATESVVVTPGQGVSLTVTPLANTVAGVAQTMKVTVYDAFGNISTVYRGTMHVSSSDYQVAEYYTFTAADAGVHTFTVAMKTAGTQSVTVADTVNALMTATQTGIVVTPSTATSIVVTPLVPTTAGVAQNVTITARDAFGNVVTGYRGTLAFTTSDTQAAMLASYTFTAADAGVHTFSVTFKSSGGQTFSATDTVNAALTYSQRDILVNAAAMVGFAFRTPSSATAGTAFTVTVSAVDAFGNTIVGYRGKVHFTGPSGGGNSLPADYTFTALDKGVHIFTVNLSTVGTDTLGIQDTVTATLNGAVDILVKASGGGGGGGSGGGGKKP